MSKDIWSWQDFNYISLKNGMDSRRAAFLLYDFLNMFSIKEFRIIQSDKNFQNTAITIVYMEPPENKRDIEDEWYEYLKKLQEEK